MITDYKAFGLFHSSSLILSAAIGCLFITWGLRAQTDGEKRRIGCLFAVVIVLIRGARYIMDIFFGVFEWNDLFSLHVCHIDLILLVIALFKPNRLMFHFCFSLGIPMGLAVALFPGSHHPAPGVPRAILFVMSHMMLVAGAFYLNAVYKLKPSFKFMGAVALFGNTAVLVLYFINIALGTNFLYIMSAPEGTLIQGLEGLFGWPGYIGAMEAIAFLLMVLIILLGRGIHRRMNVSLKAPEAEASLSPPA